MARKQNTATSLGDPFLEKALRRAHEAFDAWTPRYARAVGDWDFREGDQWDAAVAAKRKRATKPCLTINRVKQPIRQIVNEFRQNRPAVQYSPVGDGADEDTAEIRQGLYRHIEISSDADVARDIAFESAATCGFGYYRILTDYIDDESDDQEIEVKPIRDFNTVFPDPHSKDVDFSDAKYWFVIEDMSEEEYSDTYPDSKIGGTGFDVAGLAMAAPEWFPVSTNGERMVRIAEYWYVETTPYKGKGRRTAQKRKICFAKLNGREILEKREDYPGKLFPFVPMIGEDYIFGGKRVIKGAVQDMMDPQRMVNFTASAVAESIGTAVKAKMLMTPEQLEGHKDLWSQSNDSTTGVLLYNAQVNAPPPQPLSFEPPIQAIAEWRGQSIDDMQAVSGIYDPSLGKSKADQSGRAITALQQQGELSNFHYSDNGARAIKIEARIVDDLLPHIYDSERVIHIVKPDHTTEAIAINHEFPPKQGMKTFDPKMGKFDIVISVGPSYKTRRQQSEAWLLEFQKSLPPEGQARVSDLIAGNADVPVARELADRLMPPDIRAQKNGNAPDPAQLQQQLQQMGQQHQLLVQELHKLMDERQAKVLDLQSKERIALLGFKKDIEIAALNVKSKETVQLAEQQFDGYMQTIGMSHDVGLAAQDHAHATAQAQQGHDAAAEQQALAQAQEPEQD